MRARLARARPAPGLAARQQSRSVGPVRLERTCTTSPALTACTPSARADQQPSDAVHVTGPASEHPAAGQLDPDVPADGRAGPQVRRAQPAAIRVARLLAVGPAQVPVLELGQRSRRGWPAGPGRPRPASDSDVAWPAGSSVPVALTFRPMPTTIASPACSARMPASLPPAPGSSADAGQHVVGPLQAYVHAGRRPERRRHRDAGQQRQPAPAGWRDARRPQQHRESQRGARLALPAAVEPAAAGRLLLGHQDRACRGAGPGGGQQVRVRRAGLSRPLDAGVQR